MEKNVICQIKIKYWVGCLLATQIKERCFFLYQWSMGASTWSVLAGRNLAVQTRHRTLNTQCPAHPSAAHWEVPQVFRKDLSQLCARFPSVSTYHLGPVAGRSRHLTPETFLGQMTIMALTNCQRSYFLLLTREWTASRRRTARHRTAAACGQNSQQNASHLGGLGKGWKNPWSTSRLLRNLSEKPQYRFLFWVISLLVLRF